MKKLIMVVLCLCFIFFKPADKIQSIETCNLNKDTIYLNLLLYFENIYPGPNKIVVYNNQQQGILIVDSQLNTKKNITYRFKLTILIKDKEYKLILEPIEHGILGYPEWTDEYYAEFDNIKMYLKNYLDKK